METTTTSQAARAALMSKICPACRAPIVGTRPIVPCRFASLDTSFIASIDVMSSGVLMTQAKQGGSANACSTSFLAASDSSLRLLETFAPLLPLYIARFPAGTGHFHHRSYEQISRLV